jgi:hypothetical protein
MTYKDFGQYRQRRHHHRAVGAGPMDATVRHADRPLRHRLGPQRRYATELTEVRDQAWAFRLQAGQAEW